MSDFNDGLLPTPCLRMDTHFGDEYESIEFGDGTGYIKAAPILAKVGALHEEIDRLRDECGTCENVGYYIDSTRFKCSSCGYNGWTKYAAEGKDKVPNYCPNCGRKVVDV